MGEYMIGVVIWSDPSDRKAVFWCEDHGDLAFYDQSNETLDPDSFFDAGDMVQFDIVIQQNFRKARNPKLLQEGAWADLPDHLVAQDEKETPREDAQILEFPMHTQATAKERQLKKA